MEVLLGVGGSSDSLLAVEATLERTVQTGDSLTVAILENPNSETDPVELEDRIAQALLDRGLEARIVHLSGDPGPTLAKYAETEDVDRIVLGGGKRSPMGKIALGEIAEFILLNADRTVTLIR